MRRKGHDWTEEQEARLKTMVEAGHTFRQIGIEISAEFGIHVTRCAAIGKARRMGFVQQGLSEKAKRERRSAGSVRSRKRRAPSKKAPPPPAVPLDDFLPAGEIAGPGACHWVEGETGERVPSWQYCGAPTGSSAAAYCDAHLARMWRTDAEKRAANARRKKLGAIPTGPLGLKSAVVL